MKQFKLSRGFTLIELLLVIGIIAILAAIVIVAINPTRQLGSARDAQRKSDINTILNAVYQYSIDNNGRLPYSLTGAVANRRYQICVCTTVSCPSYTACSLDTVAPFKAINLKSLTGSYIVSVPQDPKFATGATAYTIIIGTNNRITVAAPYSEVTTPISVTR